MKFSVLLFSKVPEPGLVKTRLTHLKDGVFDPEVASVLYHCMLFDVAEITCAALSQLEARYPHDTYELTISTAPAENLPAMRELFESSGAWPREIVFAADHGATFDEHYNDAFAQVFARGADAILSYGADMPALTCADVVRGLEALRDLADTTRFPNGGVVMAPDQEMGVSIIGWTAATTFDHSGVFYNRTGLTVLPAYVEKARSAAIPMVYLPPVPDVDTMADLIHNITLIEALTYTAPYSSNTPPYRTAAALADIGWDEVRVPPNDLLDPRGAIDTTVDTQKGDCDGD